MAKPAPGEVEIKKMDLFSFDKTKRFNLERQVAALRIYEDVFKPTLYAEITLYDAFDIINNFPIIGEESIELSFQTTGSNKPVSYNFKVYSVTDQSREENSKGSTYTLRCVSEEHLEDGFLRIVKSYDSEIHKMIADVLYSYLKTKKGFKYEETKGAQQIVIPRMNPLMAIDFLRKRAISKKYKSNAFVFFENARGFNFYTLEKLFEMNVQSIGDKVFEYNPTVNFEDDRGKPEALSKTSFRNILHIDTPSRYDSASKIRDGMFNTKVLNFDILTKKISEKTFKFQDSFSDFVFIDKNAFTQNSKQFYDRYDKDEGMRMFVPSDSSRPDSFIADSLGTKVAYFNMILQQKTVIQTYGDTTITAGDVITCKFTSPTASNENERADARMNGNYLIIQLAHDIVRIPNDKFSHRLSMGLLKGNFSSS